VEFSHIEEECDFEVIMGADPEHDIWRCKKCNIRVFRPYENKCKGDCKELGVE